MRDQPVRTWIWVAVIVQFVGYVFDALWHGLLRPGVEPATVSEMARHLATVHLPLYLGAVSVLVVTGAALLRQIRHSRAGGALPVAFGGAVLSTAAEGWHAYSHLQLDTHHAPIAGIVSVVGFLVVVVAMSVSGARRRGRAGGATDERRAA
jgi:hypothetical protein